MAANENGPALQAPAQGNRAPAVYQNGSDISAGPAGILPHHLVELRKSGLSNATIAAAHIRSETNYQRLAALLGWRTFPKKMAPAIVYPFYAADGTNGYCRIKPDAPRKLAGKPVKYESPKGQPNQPFLPPGLAGVLDNPEAELLLTEGEKKALAAMQAGFACLGLVGVFGWKDGRSERLLPALERIAWKGRPVRIVFDSDAAENQQVRDAEARLAKHLTDRGAVVRVVRLPAGPAGDDGKPAKVGLDDFLVAHGPGELRKLLDSADEPEPIEGPDHKAPAMSLDAADEAAAMLDADTVDGLPRLRFWRGGWLRWNGAAYIELPSTEVRARAILTINRNYNRLSQRVTGDVLDQLKAQAVLWGTSEPPAWLNGSPANGPPHDWPAEEMLPAKNALVHLPSLLAGRHCTLPPTPRFFSTFALGYEFRSDAPRPDAWLTFLSQLWPDDPQSIATLQEWFGYVLTLDTSLQKMLVLIGPKRSGKSTIARVLRSMVGPANAVGPPLAAFAQNFGLWPLIGKPLAIVPDARLGGRSDQAVIVERLLSITGEDAQTIDRKHLPLWTGKLPTRLMMLTNELPRLSDSSGALAGRMILLRLRESFFGREDSALTGKLLAELPGILLWSIEGWRRLRERGRFEQPDTGRDLLGDMADLASPVGQFVRECCLVGAAYRVAVADLFRCWRQWCEGKGRREHGTEGSFGRDLHAAVSGVKKKQGRDGDKRPAVYDGIGLRDDWAGAGSPA